MSSVRYLSLAQNLIEKLDSEMPAVCAVLYQAVLLVLLHCLEESRTRTTIIKDGTNMTNLN